MLVLSRKASEWIEITARRAARIRICIVEIRGDKVRLGLEAPDDVTIHRQEISLLIAAREAERQNHERMHTKSLTAEREQYETAAPIV